ncbi:hypothetical protein SO694_00001261 [Aureococcus anophagefferens]|uniref:Uncharacterized protein n=1 Tax=Aureococcus anophagefferens TaxID=44056 RepID=A0ABR1GBK2_AURAN
MVRLGLGLDQGANEPDKLPSALGINRERIEFLYSIPQPGDVDEDFHSTWQRAVEECAGTRGWLVLHQSDLETALAHDAFGPPPGLATCLAARFAAADALAPRSGRGAGGRARGWRRGALRRRGAAVLARRRERRVPRRRRGPRAVRARARARTRRRSGGRARLRREGADEPHDDVPPATLRGCCAAAAASCGDAAAAAALARCATHDDDFAGAVRFAVARGSASVAADVDVYDLRRGLFRVGGGAAPTDADEAAVQFRAALREHARATARLEARAAAALESCRAKKRSTGAFDVVSARRWKALDAAAARARGAHFEHFERPYDALRKLWDDRSVVAALELAAGALRAARADLSADDVEAATDALAAEMDEAADVDAALARATTSGDDDGSLERELEALVADDDDLPALGGLSIADLPTPPTKPPRRAEPAS